jgi:hypothetical protein
MDFDLKKHTENLPMAKDGVVYFADKEVMRWVNGKFGAGLVAKLGVALGVLHPSISDEEANRDPEELRLNLLNWLAAGAYFYDERSTGGQSDIWVSVATDDANMPLAAAHPTVIKRVLEYPFQVRDLRRISAEIDASNERSIRNAKKLGFVEEGRKRKAGKDGGDIIIVGMLREECRIWNERESLSLEPVA